MDPDKCTEPLTWRDQHPDRRCHVHLLLLNVGTGDVGEQSHEACPGRLVIADVAHICGDPLACIAGGQSLTHHHHLSTGWELLRVGQGFARKGQQRGLLTGQQFFWHLSSPGFYQLSKPCLVANLFRAGLGSICMHARQLFSPASSSLSSMPCCVSSTEKGGQSIS